MTAQLTTPIRRHRVRNRAAIVAGIAALIAGGGYAATTTIGPDAHPAAAAGTEIAPTAQVMRELDQTIRSLYGPQPSSNTAPGVQARRQMDQTVRHLYGPRP